MRFSASGSTKTRSMRGAIVGASVGLVLVVFAVVAFIGLRTDSLVAPDRSTDLELSGSDAAAEVVARAGLTGDAGSANVDSDFEPGEVETAPQDYGADVEPTLSLGANDIDFGDGAGDCLPGFYQDYAALAYGETVSIDAVLGDPCWEGMNVEVVQDALSLDDGVRGAATTNGSVITYTANGTFTSDLGAECLGADWLSYSIVDEAGAERASGIVTYDIDIARCAAG